MTDMPTGGDVRFVALVLFEMLQSLQVSASAVALYMIRFVVVLLVLPVTAEQIINNMSRMGIAMILALYVAMGRPWDELSSLSGAEIGFIALKEAILGLALGFAMSTVFWVVEYVGALIDTAAGFNNVQLQNPMSGEQSTPVSNLLGKLAGAVFFSIGGALFFAQAMFESYQAWPLADMMPSAQGMYAVFLEQQMGSVFSNMLKLAAPVLIVVMLIDVGIGLLSRSAEKLEPASLAQPIKGVVAVLMLLVMVSVVFEPLRQFLVPRGVVQQLSPQAAEPAPKR
ncbi:type III secretion system export apparatus subunit SctT [Rubrivivax sp. RP6-9]|uniref:type III secretion system export apparatus subunit SctT n=1 Tax=Rubrivivax sp. RP6-9 TaxID=3415750 RepID=UPI003CC57570